MSVFLTILQFLGGVVCILIGIFITTTVWERVTRRKRQARILQALSNYGDLTALQLSSIVDMGTSTGFIWSALQDLERNGQVTRTRSEGRSYWGLPGHPQAKLVGSWKPHTPVAEGDRVGGSDLRIHTCVLSGTTGAYEPMWGSGMGGTQDVQGDGSAVWKTDWSAG